MNAAKICEYIDNADPDRFLGIMLLAIILWLLNEFLVRMLDRCRKLGAIHE